MNYFSDGICFDARNLDVELLKEEMEYYASVYSWYARSAIFENPQLYSNRAAIAYAISETLKAVLCLCADENNASLFNSILDKMCPVKRTEVVKHYEFVN